MEIRIFCYHFYISCVFIASFTDCKTFSLNDVIAAEQEPSQTAENLLTTTGNTISHGKKTSSLKYRKTFQISSPSKPKKLKHLQRPRNKRKKLTSNTKKREIQQNEKNNIKYIPLLRNIGMLFDNILSSGSSESNNNRKYKYKRNRFLDDDEDDTCSCASKYIPELKSDPRKTTAFTSSAIEIENETFTSAIITTTPSNNLAIDNISGFRWNKSIPLLLARNSSGVRRNNNRFRPRSGSTYIRSPEGHITRVYGNNEYFTNSRETESNNKYNEENSDSNPRNDTDSSYGLDGANRGVERDSQNSTNNGGTNETKEFIFSSNEASEDIPRNVSEHEREIKFEVRRNETKSPIFIPKFTSRLREYNTKEENTSIRTSESNEKSVTFNYTSNKRIFDRNGSNTPENKKVSRKNETIVHSLSNSSFPVGKVVMIYDGYSVARDVNGENKWSEKAIHIHS